jgi:hypothetical protein
MNASRPGTAITATAKGFYTAFPDMQVFMDDLVIEGDRIEYHWTFHRHEHDRLLEGQDLFLEGDDPLEDLDVAAQQLVVLLLPDIGLARRVLERQAI